MKKSWLPSPTTQKAGNHFVPKWHKAISLPCDNTAMKKVLAAVDNGGTTRPDFILCNRLHNDAPGICKTAAMTKVQSKFVQVSRKTEFILCGNSTMQFLENERIQP